MATLNKLFLDPCKSNWNSSMVFKWRKDFPSKNNIWQPYWIFYFEFFKFSKMSRRGPKIVHPDHPLIQLLGPPAPESIPDLRDYNIPLDYGKKTTFFWTLVQVETA